MSIKIENVDIFGWKGAIRGARNPMNSWDKSDTLYLSSYYCDDENDFKLAEQCCSVAPIIKENDHKLLMNLCKGGPEESKWRRMIHVQMDITAPLYWWKEFETYKVGTVSNSCSTMHKIQAKEFTLDDFSHEHLICMFDYPDTSIDEDFYDAEMKKCMDAHCAIDSDIGSCNVEPIPGLKCTYDAGEVIPAYILDWTIIMLNRARELFLKTKDKKYWWQMIQLLPSSYNQRRTIDLNYEVLAKQYRERKDHKLDEWRNYCEWIKSLPYSGFITLEENTWSW